MAPPREPAFDERVQSAYFESADEERFAWTTAGPGFVDLEEEVLGPVVAGSQLPGLEIGCGEGNNLFRLGRGRGWTGVDRFCRKLAFAARSLPEAQFVCGDGSTLPFPSESFETVLIRDLLHHLERPEGALSEAVRVLRPDGRLFVLEPNARNPLVRLQTRLVAAEAGARRFRPELLQTWLARLPLAHVQVGTAVPFPVRRLLFHYRLGAPRLGRSASLVSVLRGAERSMGRLLGRERWSYVVATGSKAGRASS